MNLHKNFEKIEIVKKNWKLKSKHLSLYAGSDWTRYGQRSGQTHFGTEVTQDLNFLWKLEKSDKHQNKVENLEKYDYPKTFGAAENYNK